MFKCDNKLVLVTGSSSGIGRETAIAFARKNAILALTGRNKAALLDLKNYIKKDGGKADIFPFDLTNIEHIPELVGDIEKNFNSSIDILVNNAGIGVSGLIEKVPIKEYSLILQVNFLAPLALSQSVIPGMKAKRNGQIINISSGAGKRGLPFLSAYCATKFALNALTESMRVELAPYGIKVILFSPGLVDSAFTSRTKVYSLKKNPFSLGKMLSSQEVGEKIVSASEHQKREVILSSRTKLSYRLNYWFPYLIDLILGYKMTKSLDFDHDHEYSKQ